MDVRMIYSAGMGASVPVIFLVGEDGERAERLAALVRREKLRCALVAVSVEDWNRQLSPWPAKAVFRGSEDFAGEADAFLSEMMEAALGVLQQAGSRRACLMGYSLAGLFALYAGSRVTAFEKIAALSPSVWYEGYVDYARAALPADPATRYYLSLGRKEEKAGNAVMRTVGERLRQMQALLMEQTGKDVPLVWHDGGHYTDVDRRMLAAVRWIVMD